MIVDLNELFQDNISLDKSLINFINLNYSLEQIFASYQICFEQQESSSGWIYKRICPFPDHLDQSPSFGFNPNKNCWNCFGCNRGGGPVQFVAALKEISNLEAAKLLLSDKDYKEIVHDISSSFNQEIKSNLLDFASFLQTEYRKAKEENNYNKYILLDNISFCLRVYLELKFKQMDLISLSLFIEKLKQKILEFKIK